MVLSNYEISTISVLSIIFLIVLISAYIGLKHWTKEERENLSPK